MFSFWPILFHLYIWNISVASFFCEGVMKHLPSFPLLCRRAAAAKCPKKSFSLGGGGGGGGDKTFQKAISLPHNRRRRRPLLPPPLLSLFRDIVSSTSGVGGRGGGGVSHYAFRVGPYAGICVCIISQRSSVRSVCVVAEKLFLLVRWRRRRRRRRRHAYMDELHT